MKGARMAAEMAEQPLVLAKLAERRDEIIGQLKRVVPEDLAGIVLVARGSSDNAAVFGRYVLEVASQRPVSLAAPSLSTLYGATTDHRGYLAIGISQSGRTPEIAAVMDKVRKAGARTVGITNDPDSPLATVSDAVIDIDAGAELAVPATKTFTAQLAALCLLAEAIGPTPWTTEAWERLPAGMQDVLAHTAFASATAEAIRGDGILCVARGYLLCVALEAALKIKETSGLLAQGYSAADLRHGPLAAVAESFPVLTFTARGQTQGDMNDLGSTLRAKGARVLKVHDGDDADFPIPEGLPEPFLCIVMAAAAQQIAHALALHRGLDPDSPRGLTKVTPTR